MSATPHVLIVEDNLALAENMAELFEELGAEVSITRTAAAAMTAMERRGFDLALVDIRLSGMSDGLELIPRLRSAPDTGEIILVTGNATLDSAIRAVRQGVYAYVLKPFDPEELVQMGERALHQVRLRREGEALARELATSEARYRGVVDSVEAFIVGVDGDSRISFCNRFATDTSGYAVEETHGLAFDELCQGRNGVDTRAILERAIAGQHVRDVELQLVTRHGERRIVRWSFAPTHAEDAAIRVLAIGIDVSERIELERRAAEQGAMAMMGTLTAGLAHEIRNPLNAAKLQLEVLSRTVRRVENREIREAIEGRVGIVQTEISRLSSLLQDFLSLARPRGMQRQAFPVAGIIEEVVELQQLLADQAQVTLEVNVGEDAGDVHADRAKIKQVLINLVANAIEAMRDQSQGTVTLEVVRIDTGTLEIIVRDDGPGIEPSAVKELLQPFVTTKEAGTGLGLPIAAKIVQLHGGVLRLAPCEPRGTEARFTVVDSEHT